MIGKALLAMALSVAGPVQDNQNLTRLDDAAIRAALAGNIVYYSPPGWADADAQEEFYPDGKWSGVRYMRGPSPFSGRWRVEGGELCVHAQQGLWEKLRRPDWFCRTLWRDPQTGGLQMNHVDKGFDGSGTDKGLQLLKVQPLTN